MERKWLLAVGGIVALALVGGAVAVYRGSTVKHAKIAEPAPAPRPQAPTPLKISLSGTIQAKAVVNIPATTEGIVERFFADVGDEVYEGELLAHIDNAKLTGADQTASADAQQAQAKVSDLEAQLIAARLEASRARAEATHSKAGVDRSQKEYERQDMLNRAGATARLTFEKAEKDYLKLKADSESLEELARSAEERIGVLTQELAAARSLAQSKTGEAEEAKAELGAGDVHATASGVVVARRAHAGEPVDRGMVDLFQIATNLTALQVVATSEPRLLDQIHSGQPAVVVVAEAPGGLAGSVREVKGNEIYVDFTSTAPQIRPGLTAQVVLDSVEAPANNPAPHSSR